MDQSIMNVESFSEANQSGIRIANLTKYYGDHCVFKDISFDIGPREIVSVVGPSGCGKTTLLRCLNGLIQPDEGQVVANGSVVKSPRPGIAIVFQDFGLFPWKNALDNVAYGLTVQGVKKSKAREVATKYVKMVALEGFEDRYPHQLSGGMQQRAGLARALAVEPSVLLMDEPFGALDAQTRELMQFELLQIWDKNPMSMLFVTHGIEEAVLMGDRVIVLGGSPSGIYKEVEVPLPRPRDASTVASTQFQELRSQVWDHVMTVRRNTASSDDH
ncbi:ABC transporter ATP-binding protein [Actinomycetota bacterium]|nr:ABC transporter ATP-binding protein [Actinomycetota bacterium]